MRVNPFHDAWLFLLGRTGEHQGSGAGGLLTLLFLALLVASVGIAATNWRNDASQRTGTHVGQWLMRTLVGAMWFQGSLWKLPLPIAGGFRYWTEQLATNAAFEFHRWVAAHLFLPNLAIIDPLVYLTELAMAISFILGLFVRPMAIVGMLFVAHLWLGLYLNADEWPWTYVFLIFVQAFFFLTNAGRSLGLDALLPRIRRSGNVAPAA